MHRLIARRNKNVKKTNLRPLILPFVLKWGAFLALTLLIRSSFTGSKISTADFTDVETAVTEMADLTVMQEADSQMIRRLYGLNPSDYEEIVLYYPVTNMGAEELLLVKLNNPDQAGMVSEAVDGRLATQKKSFDGYGASQTAMLEGSIFDHAGNYILFVSAENPGEIKAAFEDAL